MACWADPALIWCIPYGVKRTTGLFPIVRAYPDGKGAKNIF